jgi:outer membrane protein OmpA-like peptidoglycan-associated protein
MDFSARATERLKQQQAIDVNRVRFVSVLLAVMSSARLLCGTAAAQSAELQGLINGRSGDTVTVQTSSGNVTVVLNSDAQVEDVQGVFHARKKQMGVTPLVPGLSVQVKGSYNGQNQLVADTVKFNAKRCRPRLTFRPAWLRCSRKSNSSNSKSRGNRHRSKQHRQNRAKHEQEIEQEKAAVAAVNIWDEAEVLFANGEVKVDWQYIPKLLALCQKAKTVKGYVIPVQEYASKVGSAALNQKLSQERAQNVIDILGSRAAFG